MKIIILLFLLAIIFPGCNNKNKSQKYYAYNVNDPQKRPKDHCKDNRTDVSKFDIKGIHLGDKYEEINYNLIASLQKESKTKVKTSKPVFLGGYQITPEEKELDEYMTMNDTGFTLSNSVGNISISFDNNHKVYHIIRSKKLSVVPDLDLIEKQIFEKYGKPDKKIRKSLGMMYCWGACVKTENNIREAYCGKSLLILYHIYKKPIQGSVGSISFRLTDPILGGKYFEWKTKLKNDYSKAIERRKKAEASDLHLF